MLRIKSRENICAAQFHQCTAAFEDDILMHVFGVFYFTEIGFDIFYASCLLSIISSV